MFTKRLVRDTRTGIILALAAIWVVNLFRSFTATKLGYPLFAAASFSLLDLAYTRYKRGSFYYPFSSIVSGLLIGLIISPQLGIFPYIAAILAGFLTKHFRNVDSSHIFNPAAFGIVISAWLFNFIPAWWSVAAGGIYIFLPILAVPTLYKLNRLQFPLIYLSGYFAYFWWSRGLEAARALTFDGTLFLFAFIMLTEPRTSSIKGAWKYAFPLAVLGSTILQFLMRFNLPDTLLVSLLLGNLLLRATAKIAS